MTKEQFIDKYNLNATTISDLFAVIAHEIAKAKGEDKPAPNPIREAYERGDKIRHKDWHTSSWITKHSYTHSIDERGTVYKNDSIHFNFDEHPQDWEIYTEAEAEQVTDQEEFSDVHHKIVDGLGTILSSFGANSGIMSIVMSWGDTQDSVSTLEMLNDYIVKYIDKQPAKPKFDRDRFEAMFRAVVASGRTESYDQDFLATNICLEKLDAFYASQKGGNNE